MKRLRKAIRFDHWWWYKIPPVLSLAAAVLLTRDELSAHTVLVLFSAVWSICSVASYGHLINDAFDVEQDRLAGKSNNMANVSPAGRLAVCLATLASGLVPLYLFRAAPLAWVLILADYL